MIAEQLSSGEEVSGEFVVARGDGTEVLELIEEAFDEIAFAVERKIARRAWVVRLALGGMTGVILRW